MKENLAVVPFIGPKDKDGDDGGEPTPVQIIIDVAQNGYIVNVNGTEESDGAKVYLFNGKGEDGPKAMIQDIINNLGLVDKVKLEK
jgi:hypothetical protein